MLRSAAQQRNGAWLKVQKNPLDKSKASKAGRLALIELDGEYRTMIEIDGPYSGDKLETVFENGEIRRHQTLTDIRERAKV